MRPLTSISHDQLQSLYVVLYAVCSMKFDHFGVEVVESSGTSQLQFQLQLQPRQAPVRQLDGPIAQDAIVCSCSGLKISDKYIIQITEAVKPRSV
jgi:hypothetical protein